VIAKGTGITFVDVDHSGKPSVGDIEIGTTVFLDPKSATPVGRGWVTCMQVSASGGRYQCQGLAHFPAGDIATLGPFNAGARTSSISVVGGTGTYAHVTGLQTTTWLDKNFARAKVSFALES
jgi:hypothetical protein